MTSGEIIEKIMYEYHLNARQFALSIGIIPQQVYDLQKGKTKNISDELASKILTKYSNINKAWLLSGEGEMFVDNTQKPFQSTFDISSLQIIVNEMSAQREMSDRHMTEAFSVIKHFQEQTDRMITLLENQQR